VSRQRKPLRLALIQMRVEGGSPAANLRRAEEMIASAAGNGADVVLLPEAMDLGWLHPPPDTDVFEMPDGDTCGRLCRAAADNRLYVCSGLVETAGGRRFNTAILVDPSGEVVLTHRKINKLAEEDALYGTGGRLSVCETEFGTWGLMICSDAFAEGQVLSRSLGEMGADLILSPCSWAVPADHDNTKDPYGKTWLDCYSPVAKDFSIWIAGASNVGWIRAGPWAGRKGIGCSLVVGPDGTAAASGPYGVDAETILYAPVAPSE